MVYGVNVKPVHSYHLDVDVLDSALDHVELALWRIHDRALELAV